ncbi:hypothetical protein DI09_58p40 [Mitosporidium daphniae]|uniref:Peptidase S8/S53 domain-containing protein n=1 Tax=Mitosporidium daphniae TaxID=1485682 RepID=A0A098VNS8_9MICR|nr:uncharacterized protein DI09_58p40 [Mitosporidium daphniae]KGG50732.1 hypothetical protein DI09_58p40 [Mitosporidium daphniae]|eukprot:XP_013237173.1 uncharacterized protein DI09_58p40 [Mitosporidium daphniae]
MFWDRLAEGGMLASNADEINPRKRHIVSLVANFRDPESKFLLQSIKEGTVAGDFSTHATAPPSISGAFSVDGMHGVVGEFSSEEISFLAAHAAVKEIEEDTVAEVAIGNHLLDPKSLFGLRNGLMGGQNSAMNEDREFPTNASEALPSFSEVASPSRVPLERKCIFGSQSNPPSWGLPSISGQQSQFFRYPLAKGKDVRIYVIDTGIDGSLPSFGSRVEGGWSIFESNRRGDTNPTLTSSMADSSLTDEHGHGTHVAGIIGGQETGVAKDATIISVRVFRAGTGPVSNVIAGLAWIISQKKSAAIELVNLSITSTRSSILNAMLESAWKANLFVITASGNQAANACNISPAASAPWILSVGAYCENRQIAPFSNRGTRCVHIYAPGCNIFSLVAGAPGALLALNGTSMAAPHATGLAALLLSTPWMARQLSSLQRLRNIIVDELSSTILDENGHLSLKALSMEYLYKFCPR